MKQIAIFVFAVILAACSDNKEDCCTLIEAKLDLAITDSAGNNLLNTAQYPFNAIRAQYYHHGLLQNAQAPSLIEDDSVARIRVFLNLDEENEYPVTYLKWNDVDTDTIKAHFNRTSSSVIADQIWVNDVLITDYKEPGHFYMLVK